MNKKHIVLLFFLSILLIKGFGQVSTTQIKPLKKIDKSSLNKKHLLTNISFKGEIVNQIYRGKELKNIQVSIHSNGSPLNPSIAKLYKLRVNNAELRKYNSNKFRISIPRLEFNSDLIVSYRASVNPTQYKDVLRGIGSIKPINLISPKENYVFDLGQSRMGHLHGKGLLISWTPTSDKLVITVSKKAPYNSIRILHLEVSGNRNSLRIKNSILEAGEEYYIQIQQHAKALDLKGASKSISKIKNLFRIVRIFKTAE